jgi:HlyD family secretion protein
MAALSAPSLDETRAPDSEVLVAIGASSGARRRWPWIAAALVAVVGLAALVAVQVSAPGAGPRFELAAVARGELTALVTATGRLQGLNTVEVGAEVSGRVVEVNADFNEHVEHGQVLAVIDPEQLRSAVEEARAQLASAEASVVQAQATAVEARLGFERSQTQFEQGLIARREHEAAQAALARADATLLSACASTTLARAALGSASSRLAKSTIRAPMAGMVLARLIEPGQTVTAGFQTPVLFKLTTDLTRMTLYVDIDEADIGRVREGQRASFSVDAYPGQSFASQVVQLRNEPTLSQNVVTYQAVLSVDNARGLLRPGMTATAHIVTSQVQDALLVPNAALRFAPSVPHGGPFRRGAPQEASIIAPGQPRVWVLDGDRPRAVAVTTGLSDGTRTAIQDGALAEGGQVIVNTLAQAGTP